MRFLVLATLAALCMPGCGGGSGSSGTTTVTISGVVVDFTSNEPVSGVPVVIGDHGPLLTDANGAFTLSIADEPYTAIVFDPDTATAVVYQGLTRHDPTLVRRRVGASTGSLTVEGTASGGGTGWPLPAGHVARVFAAVGRVFTSSGLADATTGAYSRNLIWWGYPDEEATLTALQFEQDNDDLLVAVTGYGRITVPLQNGGTITMQDIVLDPVVSTVSFDGAIVATPGELTAAWLGIWPPQGGTCSLPRKAGALPAYALEGPTIPGAVYDVNVQATRFDASYTIGTHFDAAPGSTGLVSVLPSAPYLVLPSPGVGAVDYTTSFASTPVPDAVYEFGFSSGGGTIFVLSETADVTVPDLSHVGMGLVPGATYTWSVSAYGPYADLDDAAGPGGYERPAAGFRFRASSSARTFTAAP